jgi:hypothetical protein
MGTGITRCMAAIDETSSPCAAHLPVALEVQHGQRSKEAQLAGQGTRYPEVGQVPALGGQWAGGLNCLPDLGQQVERAGLWLMALSTITSSRS